MKMAIKWLIASVYVIIACSAEIKNITPEDIIIEKDFLYDQHTLQDEYPYKDTTRRFQWDKIKEGLALLENFQAQPSEWGILQNRHNVHGRPPVAKNAKKDVYYNEMDDSYGVEGTQSIPLYSLTDTVNPERYGRDGSLIKITGKSGDEINARLAYFDGDWIIPAKYVKKIDPQETTVFKKVVFVDRTNQNVATLEKENGKWLVRSMNPATTGAQKTPFQRETPLGIFVIQEKKERMQYLVDGTDRVGGFAPYASRFSNGGYLHGVPVNNPQTQMIEFSSTLGTIPRSHMCVRNATSHAKFLYDWAPVAEALVYVIE
ncbi:MAG: L,D-transpeptidase [Tannerellaceae bacterium]|nr:L,D-transpeptidase [Tannerellaceae bacterium]